MPFKSDKQRKFVFVKAKQGEKWAIKFLKDSGVDMKKFNKYNKKRSKKPEMENQSIDAVLSDMIDNVIFEEINNLSKFEEYKHDAERENDVYCQLVDCYFENNNDDYYKLTNLDEHISKIDYVRIYTEAATDLAVGIFDKLYTLIAEKAMRNKMLTEDDVADMLTSRVAELTSDKDYIQQMKDNAMKTINAKPEAINAAIDDYINKLKLNVSNIEESKEAWDFALEIIANDFLNIKKADYFLIAGKHMKNKDMWNKVVSYTKQNLDYFKRLKSGHLKNILTMFHTIVTDKIFDTIKKPENIEGATIKDIYDMFAQSGGEKAIRDVLSNKAQLLDKLLKTAINTYGKNRPQDEKAKLIDAKTAIIAHIVMMLVFRFMDGIASTQKFTKDAEKTAFTYDTENMLLDVYMDLMYYQEIQPINYLKNKVKQLRDFQSFKKVVNNFGRFMREYLYTVPYSLEKVNNILSPIGASIDPDEIKNILDNGIDKSKIQNASDNLSKYIDEKQDKILNMMENLIGEYIPQTLSAKLGQKVGQAVGTIGGKIQAAREARAVQPEE